MKPNVAIKRTRRRLFWGQVVSFSILFAVLGVVVALSYEHAIYRDVDQSVRAARQQLTSTVAAPPLNTSGPNAGPTPIGGTDGHAPTQTNLVAFNAKGKITNADMIGERFYAYFKTLTLHKNQVGELHTATTSSGTFRTLLVKVPKTNDNPAFAGKYVLILQNIDPQLAAVRAFRTVLIFTILLFLALALALAWWLANRGMRPIKVAWQAQQDFVADAAHELRAPLAVIQSQQEALLTRPNATVLDQSEAIATTLTATKQLRRLTSDLLTIAQSDSDTAALVKTVQPLTPIIQAATAPYADIATTAHKHLDVQLPADDVTAAVDAQRLQQLVVILLDNAFKYTASGDSIWVSLTTDKTTWQLTVGNSGQSIGAAAKAHIFERFYREDGSRSRETGGAGLGLAIGQWVVQAHGGSITVHDVMPHGVRFTATFPR